MPATLPPAIVAGVEALGQALTEWGQQHRDASLATHEEGVLAAVRAALPGLLGAVVQQSTTALAAAQQRQRELCPTCGTRREARHQWRKRPVRTSCGPLRYARPRYRCRPCHQEWSPADQTLGVAPRARLSARLDDWLAEVGAERPFLPAAALLERLTGVQVSKETVRLHSEQRGTALEAAQQAAVQQVLATGEPAETGDAVPGTLLVETDGVMVRYRPTGWHEVKVGLVGGWEAARLQAPSYVAAREEAAGFGPRLLTEAARRGALDVVDWAGARTGAGLARLRAVVVLGDGAAWIWNLAAEHFGERTEIVDFYHASEHLWTLAHALYGPETAAAAAWATARLQTLREAGGAALLPTMRGLRPTSAEAQEVLRRERGYFRTHAARMAYPTFVAQGWPIGSGAVESAAKHLVQLRLKRPGARWSPAGAQALLTLLAHLASRPTRATRSGEHRRQAEAAARRRLAEPTEVEARVA
jgi:Uncharacterised protein family (UPF0236)